MTKNKQDTKISKGYPITPEIMEQAIKKAKLLGRQERDKDWIKWLKGCKDFHADDWKDICVLKLEALKQNEDL